MEHPRRGYFCEAGMAETLLICVPADAGYLKCIRGFIQPVLQSRFAEDEVRQLTLAIDEACSNVIKHGQSWFLPKGTISVEMRDGKRKTVVIIHNFCKMKDVDKIKPRDLDDIKPGGLGTHFIAEVMDKFEFVPDAEQEGRMALVMTKNTPGRTGHETDD